MSDIEILTSKAQTFLHSAELTMRAGDYDTCASRCYYAMFLMAEAALLTKDLKSSSHKGVISLFGQHFAKTGILADHMGKTLNHAYQKRIIGDYGVGLSVAQDEAEVLLEATREFTKDYLDKWAQQKGQA